MPRGLLSPLATTVGVDEWAATGAVTASAANAVIAVTAEARRSALDRFAGRWVVNGAFTPGLLGSGTAPVAVSDTLTRACTSAHHG